RRRGAGRARARGRRGVRPRRRARRGARAAVRRPRLERLPPPPGGGARRARPPPGTGELSDLTSTVSPAHRISVTINGTAYEREVEARKLLIHFIRDDLDLTGSHIGCDTGNCGACSVIVDGTLVK